MKSRSPMQRSPGSAAPRSTGPGEVAQLPQGQTAGRTEALQFSEAYGNEATLRMLQGPAGGGGEDHARQPALIGRASVQLRAAASGATADPADVHAQAAEGLRGSASPLPHLDAIRGSFGAHDVSQVQAHVGGPAQEASAAMGASAYATGNDVAFADSPDLHTAAHEAAHVVQQRGGVQLKGGVGKSGDRYEQEADAVADKVVAGASAEGLLNGMASPGQAQEGRAVQRIAGDGNSALVGIDLPPWAESSGFDQDLHRYADLVDFYSFMGALVEDYGVPGDGDWGDFVNRCAEKVDRYAAQAGDTEIGSWQEIESAAQDADEFSALAYQRAIPEGRPYTFAAEFPAELGGPASYSVGDPQEFRTAALHVRGILEDAQPFLEGRDRASEMLAELTGLIEATDPLIADVGERGHVNGYDLEALEGLFADSEAATVPAVEGAHFTEELDRPVGQINLPEAWAVSFMGTDGDLADDILRHHYMFLNFADKLELLAADGEKMGWIANSRGIGPEEVAAEVEELRVGMLDACVAAGENHTQYVAASESGSQDSQVAAISGHLDMMETLGPAIGAYARILDEGNQRAQVEAAFNDLGEVSSPGAFAAAAGAFVDTIIPYDGTQARAEVHANFPVASVGVASASIGFSFVAYAERNGDDVKLGASVGFSATAEVDIVVLEAFLRASVFGYIEASGDSSAECFELILMAIERGVRDVSEEAADAVFDPAEIRRTERGMDQDDYVEAGLGFSLSAGFSAGSGDERLGASAGYSRRDGTRIVSDEGDGVRDIDTRADVFNLAFNLPHGFSAGAAFTIKLADGQFAESQLKVNGRGMVPIAELRGLLAGGDFLTSLYDGVGDLLTLAEDADASAGQIVGAIRSGMNSAAPPGFGAADLADEVLANVPSFEGVELGYEVELEAKLDASLDFGVQVKLMRVQSLSFGENDRDSFHASLELLNEIICVP